MAPNKLHSPATCAIILGHLLQDCEIKKILGVLEGTPAAAKGSETTKQAITCQKVQHLLASPDNALEGGDPLLV